MSDTRAFQLQCGKRLLDLSTPQVMGVLNNTPDSFSDGGSLYRNGLPDKDLVIARVRQMVEQGAAIIDVGGESTRPGAAQVSIQQELDRVVPLVELIAGNISAVISIDTSTPEVMLASHKAGAGMINDVRALRREGALDAVAAIGLPVCLMHMQGEPVNMQDAPGYTDVVRDVTGFLEERIAVCERAGVERKNILLDPGFGFGKTLQHNLTLLNKLSEFSKMKVPIVVGMSRKSMIGAVLKRDVGDRLAGGLALAALAVERGANIVRTHDVKETVDAINMVQAVLREQEL